MRPATVSGEKETLKKFVDKAVIVQHWSHDSSNLYFLCLDEEIDAIIDDEPPAAESASDEVMKLDLYHFSFPQKAVDEEGIRIAVPHDSRLFLCIFRRHMILMADPSLINQLIRFGAKTITVQGI